MGARDIHTAVQESTFEFVVGNREDMLGDMLEVYRRGDEDAPRPECCPPPFDPEFHNWMLDYPQAYVIPVGEGQRSDAEANRLVEWLLFNEIEVDELERDYRFGSQTFEKGSYVVWMAQTRRGLADTALSLGVDISDRIQRLYAPPAAWSHGYLWGADTVTIPDGARFSPRTDEIRRPNRLKGSVPRGRVEGYTLQIDSPTAVRALNALVRAGADASLATAAFSGGPAGTAVFGADRARGGRSRTPAREFGLDFGRLGSGALPSLKPIERVPRIAVMSSFGDPPTGARSRTRAWIRASGCCAQLGFDAEPTSLSQLNNAPTDPLLGYDILFNTSGFPAATNNQGQPINVVARQRIPAVLRRRRRLHRRPVRRRDVPAPRTQAWRTGLTGGPTPRRQRLQRHRATGTTPAAPNSVITGAYPATRHRDRRPADLAHRPCRRAGASTRGCRRPAFFAAGLWPADQWTTAPPARRSSPTAPTRPTRRGWSCSPTTRCTAPTRSASGRWWPPRPTGRTTRHRRAGPVRGAGAHGQRRSTPPAGEDEAERGEDPQRAQAEHGDGEADEDDGEVVACRENGPRGDDLVALGHVAAERARRPPLRLVRDALRLLERRALVELGGVGLREAAPDDEEADHEDQDGEDAHHGSMTVTPRCAKSPIAASSAPASSRPIVRPIRRPGSTAPDAIRRSSAS